MRRTWLDTALRLGYLYGYLARHVAFSLAITYCCPCNNGVAISVQRCVLSSVVWFRGNECVGWRVCLLMLRCKESEHISGRRCSCADVLSLMKTACLKMSNMVSLYYDFGVVGHRTDCLPKVAYSLAPLPLPRRCRLVFRNEGHRRLRWELVLITCVRSSSSRLYICLINSSKSEYWTREEYSLKKECIIAALYQSKTNNLR